MAALIRERAVHLLATANNHGDLSVKLSSLSQVRDILLSIEHSYAGEIFPYLIELQASPESLVRKLLIEVIKDVGLKAVEQSSGSFEQLSNGKSSIIPSTKWEQVKEILGDCGRTAMQTQGSTSNPFGSTFVYGYRNVAFEVRCSVDISGSFATLWE